MLLDKGGAEVRRGVGERQVSMPGFRLPSGFEKPAPNPAAKVLVSISETHDGRPCDCIDETKTLAIGDQVELTHVCHDGRVDKLIVKIEKIGLAVEHGTVS